jgi:DNA polymerase-3 subunit alpha
MSRKPAGAKGKLFNEPIPEFHLPQLQHHYLDDALDEMELLGFTMCNPFELVEAGHTQNYVAAADMPNHLGNTITMLGYLITWKPVHTIKHELMYFGTFIDANGDWLDTVHFPDSVKQYPLQGKGFYRMTGKVVEEFGVYNLDVHHLEKLGIKSRAATKAGALLEKQKGWQQGLIRRG